MFIKFENIYFKYSNNKDYVLKNVSFEIKEGEIISILGSSGSGKSTILRLLSGLEIPNKGNIYVNNEVLASDKVFILPEKRNIGMVFQDYALFPHLTVEKNIAFGLKDKKSKIIYEMLNLIGMTEYMKRYPYELSGGQQQRVAIARALAQKPRMILLDEPFSNLDENLKDKIRDDIKKILRSAGITSIFVTHDKNDSKALSDRSIYINRGIIQ